MPMLKDSHITVKKVRIIMDSKIAKVLENLQKNNMEAYFAKDKDEALKTVESLIKKGDTVSVGGSVTLNEIGVLDLLSNGDYNFLDRYKKGLTPEEIRKVFTDTFAADSFLCSANAITESGELYNIDGNCNRIAALTFGPKSVIVVAGKNKIVPTLKDAVLRVKTVAAPKNCIRLGLDTYCAKNGECVSLKVGDKYGMLCGCNSPDRICATATVTSMQRNKGRIKVIIVDEELGY